MDLPQSWYVNRLHHELKSLENDNSDKAKQLRSWFGEILHMMVFDGMHYDDATRMMNEKIEMLIKENNN
jgi:hypothetical protein